MNENNKLDFKRKIIKVLQKESKTQEFLVKESLKNIQFNNDDYSDFEKKILSQTNFNAEIVINLLNSKDFHLNVSNNFIYTDSSTNKIRELDILCQALLLETERCLSYLTLVGDVKNTDNYRWVFQNYDRERLEDFMERGFGIEFPLVLEHPDYHKILLYSSSNYDKIFSNISDNLIPFHPNGKKTSKKEAELIKRFFKQLENGVLSLLSEEKLKNFSQQEESQFYKRIKEKIVHFIVPILVISSDIYFYRKVPPQSDDDIIDLDAILYLHSISDFTKSKRTELPIYIINQRNLEATVKQIILKFKFMHYLYESGKL